METTQMQTTQTMRYTRITNEQIRYKRYNTMLQTNAKRKENCCRKNEREKRGEEEVRLMMEGPRSHNHLKSRTTTVSISHSCKCHCHDYNYLQLLITGQVGYQGCTTNKYYFDLGSATFLKVHANNVSRNLAHLNKCFKPS
jgi:hypothetical protein